MCTRVLRGRELPWGLVPAPAGSLLSPGFWGAAEAFWGPPGGACCHRHVCVRADVELRGRNLRVSTGGVCAGLCDDLQHIFAL